MTNPCEVGGKLGREWLDFDMKTRPDEHCCNSDECCEGIECGLDCCNEDGRNGHCFCAEDSEPLSKDEDKKWTKLYLAHNKHRDNCKQCKDAHEGK